MRKAILFSLFAVLANGAQARFDPEKSSWTLDNGIVRTIFQLTPEGYFVARSVADLNSGDEWSNSENRPFVQLALDGTEFDGQTQYALIQQSVAAIKPSGVRQTIVLQDVNNTAQFTVVLDLHDGQPVIRYRLGYRNLTSATVFVTRVNLMPWSFAAAGERFTAFRVNQWSVFAGTESFAPAETVLVPDGTAVTISAGARGAHCGWLALRDGKLRGLFAGWEFDGRSQTRVLHAGSSDSLELDTSIEKLHHPVPPRAEFVVPGAFLGLFHGDFDEAGFRTQRFTEAVLAKQPAEAKIFPHIGWDSWGYEQKIDEQTLRRNADLAAAIGVELFTVDLGWARSIGDWQADPEKFPSGLNALADYVHSLGMKFGLHFALAEADPNSPVLQQNPDWRSTEKSGYFGADSLCLSNEEARDWLIQQAIRLIDDYHVDWVLQDGENMVKECTKITHSHDPDDSNYANAVAGINAVVQAVQAARPNVQWENCENGGSMMTFNMVQLYVTSLTNDASGSLASRHAVFGATYPFPPRYAGRYMPASDGMNRYATNSYRFGGNWMLMNRLTDLTDDETGFLKREIGRYKSERVEISNAKVYHLEPPAADATDAIQSHNQSTDTAIAVVTRANSAGGEYLLRPRGLDPEARYLVWLENDAAVYSLSGEQLMNSGIRVPLPSQYSSDVAHITRQ